MNTTIYEVHYHYSEGYGHGEDYALAFFTNEKSALELAKNENKMIAEECHKHPSCPAGKYTVIPQVVADTLHQHYQNTDVNNDP